MRGAREPSKGVGSRGGLRYTWRMQRIVAGTLGGRKLLALPRGVQGVRPSSSRVRSAIFDRLQREVRGARVLDLFAGSGALAIEALSRGAAHATLVERHGPLTRFLTRQIEALDLVDRTAIVRDDARRVLTREPARALGPDSAGPFDLVLVDPPYAEHALYNQILAALAPRPAGGWLAADAIVVIEAQRKQGRRAALELPPALRSEAIREHGHTVLEFLRFAPA